MMEGAIKFITTDIWRIRRKELRGLKTLGIKLLRILLLSMRGFDEDKCIFRASALTFYSLLSIVPVFAMAFGLAKGFGLEKALERMIYERFHGQEEIIERVTGFALSLLANAQGGVIAGIGILFLFWATIRVLGNIENAFNHIWGIKKSRSLPRKISDYLSAMLISPILLIVSSALTVVIRGQVESIVQRIELLRTFNPAIFFALKFLPYWVIWVLFTFIYIFMPNTKIRFRSGLFGGLIAGTLYQIFQFAYVTFQIGVSKYNAIYGSFTALPLFLVWLQLSWIILLFGAEISFAHQNEESYEFQPDCEKISESFRRLLTLRTVHFVVKEFARGVKPHTAEQIARKLAIPIRLMREMLRDLVESAIISETCEANGREVAYQPAQDVDLFTIKYVIDALERRGMENIPVASSEALERISECLRSFDETLKQSPANRLLKDI